jgi:quercetin dioxygenase-like cupin family protein
MKLLKIEEALKNLPPLNDEIRYKGWVEDKSFSAGLISFHPKKKSDRKQIQHADRDVLCHVLKGRGRLRVNGRRIALKPGIACHIPRGTRHDFAAAKGSRLVLFYSLIKTR